MNNFPSQQYNLYVALYPGKKGTPLFSKPSKIQRDDVSPSREEASPAISTWYEVSSSWPDWLGSCQNSPHTYWLSCPGLKGLKPRKSTSCKFLFNNYNASYLLVVKHERAQVTYALDRLVHNASYMFPSQEEKSRISIEVDWSEGIKIFMKLHSSTSMNVW